MAQMARSVCSATTAADVRRVGVGRRDEVQLKTLNSWKEIAGYLGRAVRTVQRWHCDLQLPAHKVRDTLRSPVFAFPAELDSWMRTCAENNEKKAVCGDTQKARSALRLRAEETMTATAQMLSLIRQQQQQLVDIGHAVKRLLAVQRRRNGVAGHRRDC